MQFRKWEKKDFEQMIDLGDGFKTSIGRMNRDYAQRVAHEIHHYMRGQNFHGPNLNNHVEGTHDHPQAEKAADETAYLDALKDVKHSSGSSMYDFILGELNNNLGIEQMLTSDFQSDMDDYSEMRDFTLPAPKEDDYRVKKLPHIPNIKRGFKTKVQKRMEREGVPYQEALVEELRESHNVIDSETDEVSEGPHRLTRSKLLDLVGLNEELGAKDSTELYHSDEPMITADDLTDHVRKIYQSESVICLLKIRKQANLWVLVFPLLLSFKSTEDMEDRLVLSFISYTHLYQKWGKMKNLLLELNWKTLYNLP